MEIMESNLTLKTLALTIKFLLFIPTIRDSTIVMQVMMGTGVWGSRDEITDEILNRRPLTGFFIFGLASVLFVPLLLVLGVFGKDAVNNCVNRLGVQYVIFKGDISPYVVAGAVFMGVVDMVQTLVLLPLSFIIIFSSESPADIFVNLVALQGFAFLDDIAAEAMGSGKDNEFINKLTWLYYDWDMTLNNREKEYQQREKKNAKNKWQQVQKFQQRIDVALNSVFARLKAVDDQNGLTSCLDALQGRSPHWNDIVELASMQKLIEEFPETGEDASSVEILSHHQPGADKNPNTNEESHNKQTHRVNVNSDVAEQKLIKEFPETGEDVSSDEILIHHQPGADTNPKTNKESPNKQTPRLNITSDVEGQKTVEHKSQVENLGNEDDERDQNRSLKIKWPWDEDMSPEQKCDNLNEEQEQTIEVCEKWAKLKNPVRRDPMVFEKAFLEKSCQCAFARNETTLIFRLPTGQLLWWDYNKCKFIRRLGGVKGFIKTDKGVARRDSKFVYIKGQFMRSRTNALQFFAISRDCSKLAMVSEDLVEI